MAGAEKQEMDMIQKDMAILLKDLRSRNKRRARVTAGVVQQVEGIQGKLKGLADPKPKKGT